MRTFEFTSIYLLAGIFLTSVSAGPISNVFERQASTCSASGSTQCVGDGLPSDFCCGTGTSCLVLASNTTVLCCPEGETCDIIEPVTCDITQQNVSTHPDTTLMTTNLTGTLETCGSKCCPFGYACDGSANCVINPDQDSTSPTATSTSISPTATSSLTVSATASVASTTEPATTSPSSTAAATTTSSKKSGFSVGTLLAGFFPGLVLGGVITLATICFIGARKRRKEFQQLEKRPGTSSSFGCGGSGAGGTTLVSEPIYTASNSAVRTDFLRRPGPNRSETPTPIRDPAIQRISTFRQSTSSIGSDQTHIEETSPTSPLGLNNITANNGNIRAMPPLKTVPRPQPPRINQPREPSSASINVALEDYANNGLRISFLSPPTNGTSNNNNGNVGLGVRNLLHPDAARDLRGSQNTTFSAMMNRADLGAVGQGEPYVPRDAMPGRNGASPGRTPPGMM